MKKLLFCLVLLAGCEAQLRIENQSNTINEPQYRFIVQAVNQHHTSLSVIEFKTNDYTVLDNRIIFTDEKGKQITLNGEWRVYEQ